MDDRLDELLRVDPALWHFEFEGIASYFSEFGERVPKALATELAESRARVAAMAPPAIALRAIEPR
jgi:GTP-dependent phosphoenolpyruvate carboxykinase